MDPTARFFTALRKLAVTLESETVKLQQVFENRNDDDDDSDSTAKAIRAYHEVNCDVRELKGQIKGQVAQQRGQEAEVSSFIKACRVMEQKVSTDIQTLKEHWEKYGYQDHQRPTKAKDEAPEAEDEAAEENETKSSTGGGGEGGEGESQQDDEGSRSSSPPPPPPFTDVLRTPQLSDFGLSEVEMKRALAGLCSEVPPMPELSLPHPSLDTPGPPPHMALTPKRALRMDDDELLTPPMPDFVLSEHTMCLNNDFTMDLFRKNVEKPQRPALEMPVPPVNVLMEGLHSTAQDLVSPEPPVFYTPGFKIRKTNGRRSQPAQGDGDPESPPGQPGNLPSTPEVPAFQTPYMNRMATSRNSARKAEPINMQADGADPPSPRSTAAGSKRLWEYDVPGVTVAGVEDKEMPEMPNLESVLGNSLQTRSAKMQKKTSGHKKESAVTGLELDGPTQEFSFGTPRLRTDEREQSTPEMPDLSSVTQDICKLLTQAQLKRTAMAVVHPNVRPYDDKIRAVRLSEVSESEFQSLPKYLKQMTLNSLNQAVHSINAFTEESRGQQTEFRMEELRRICSAGTKTPVYILCLTELRRLEHTGGARNTSVYRLCTLR
ncbi:spindle and kinetochore-associated protein 3 [Cebidichthys violaceus]|uniref:spindle and kinetochore-associated protein 3 n=1 Tax=Cebidichthys violaceus TaxID=271503 RepID=UPI0035CC1745